MALLIRSGELPPLTARASPVLRPGYTTRHQPSKVTEVSTRNVVPRALVSTNTALSTIINSLSDDRLGLVRPLRVELEIVDDEEVIATFEEANISMSGDDIRDAIHGLRAEIVATYNLYKTQNRLGPEPSRRLKVLEGFVGQKQSSKG
jgi:hypothetical protein